MFAVNDAVIVGRPVSLGSPILFYLAALGIGKIGIVDFDNTSMIIDFEEKPEYPKSNFAATACYIFSKSDVQKLE